jgi:hypothetical protein
MSALYILDSTGIKFKQVLSSNNKSEFLQLFFTNMLIWGSCCKETSCFISKNNLYNDFILLAFEKLNESLESLSNTLELKYSTNVNQYLDMTKKINSFLKLFKELFIRIHHIECSNLFIAEDTKNLILYMSNEDEQIDGKNLFSVSVGNLEKSCLKSSVMTFKSLQNENGVLIPLLCGHNGVYSDSEIQGLIECMIKIQFCEY